MSKDLTRQQTTTTGPGAWTMTSSPGCRTFIAAGYGVGDGIHYAAEGFDALGAPTNEREVGVGTLAVGGAFVRTAPSMNSNGLAAALAFTAARIVITDAATIAAVTALATTIANAAVAALSATLGSAATRNVGGTAGTVTAGDDTRLADARTPTAHASTHVDGADPVLLFDVWRVSGFGSYIGVSNINAVPTPIGVPAWVESGAVQRNIAATSLFTSRQRRGYVSAATAGLAVGGRSQAILLRDFKGFRYSTSFGVSDAALVAGARMFAGLRNVSTVPTDVQIDSVINAIGVGHEAGDVGYSVFHNDAAGVATKVPLNSTKFPTSTTATDIIRVEITTRKAAGDVVVTVTNVTTGETETVILTTDLPALSTPLTPTLWRGNGAAAAAVGVDFFRIFIDDGQP